MTQTPRYFGVLAVAVAVVVAEFTVRLQDYVRAGVPWLAAPSAERDLRVTDSLGVHGRANGHFEQMRLDSFGFRGPEVRLSRREGCQRVVVLGASETFGYGLPDGREYPAQLRDSLAAHGCYEIINAAIVGMSLPSAIHYWYGWVARFHPDIVMYYPSPVFYLNDDPPGFPGPWRHPSVGSAGSPWWTPRLLDRAKQEMRYPAFIQRRRVQREIARRVAGRPASWFFQGVPEARLALFTCHLDSLVTAVSTSGARLMLLTHAVRFPSPPAKQDRDLLDSWRRFTPRASSATLLAFERAAAVRVRETASRGGVTLVDVDSALTGHRALFQDAVHFSDLGAARLGGLLAQSLRAEAADRGMASAAVRTRPRPFE